MVWLSALTEIWLGKNGQCRQKQALATAKLQEQGPPKVAQYSTGHVKASVRTAESSPSNPAFSAHVPSCTCFTIIGGGGNGGSDMKTKPKLPTLKAGEKQPSNWMERHSMGCYGSYGGKKEHDMRGRVIKFEQAEKESSATSVTQEGLWTSLDPLGLQ